MLRYNEPVNAERQATVSEALGLPHAPASEVVRAFIRGLGLPCTLRDVGVTEDQFDRLAKQAMHDRWIPTNPRRIEGPEPVRMLLEAAW